MRIQEASWDRVWCRRTRRKSYSASTRGEPVSLTMAPFSLRSGSVGCHRGDLGRDVQHLPRDDVADGGGADVPVRHRLAVGVDVSVQVPGRLEPLDDAVQRLDADVRTVLAIA